LLSSTQENYNVRRYVCLSFIRINIEVTFGKFMIGDKKLYSGFLHGLCFKFKLMDVFALSNTRSEKY